MRISVVITTYNLAPFIKECVRSVVNQTHKASEIIIADDCSSDNTVALAQSISKNIIVVRQSENSGALLNTLAGLNRSTGDIVAFIDGDDTWPTEKLEQIHKEFLSDSSVCLVTHNHRRVDSNGKPLGITDETHRNLGKLKKIKDAKERQIFLRRSALHRKGIWFGSAYSLRREALPLDLLNNLIDKNQNSQFSYLDLVIAPFVIQYNPNGKISYLENLVFDYRIHTTNSASSNTIEKQLLAIKRGRSTNLVTKFLLSEINAPASILKSYDTILLEYDYLEALYTSKRFKSISLFFRLFTHFQNRGYLFKEIIRIILNFSFGSKFFLSNK